jgi:hypothetical protein
VLTPIISTLKPIVDKKDIPYIQIDTITKKHTTMALLKEDGSLDIERINQLPIEEYMEEIGCCSYTESDNMNWLDAEIKQTLTAKKL